MKKPWHNNQDTYCYLVYLYGENFYKGERLYEAIRNSCANGECYRDDILIDVRFRNLTKKKMLEFILPYEL